MAVLTIRAHTRFAVCRRARIEHAGGAADDAVLIELSLEGCRLGNIAGRSFAPGERVRVEVAGAPPFTGTARWQGGATLGLKLERAFHVAELDRLIRLCRGELDGKAAGSRAAR